MSLTTCRALRQLTGLALNGGKKIQINIDLARFTALEGMERLPPILFPVMYTNEVRFQAGQQGPLHMHWEGKN